LGDSLPETYQYYVGGISTYYVKNAFPFIGQRLLEHNSKNVTLLRFDLQFELFKRNYLIARANAGQMASQTHLLISSGKSIFGYGLAYGYNSIIGPMEFTLMSSPQHKLLAYLNIGFWF
jgi:NTE family protein